MEFRAVTYNSLYGASVAFCGLQTWIIVYYHNPDTHSGKGMSLCAVFYTAAYEQWK